MKKFYIPTSIAYTNQRPHIGFALEVIQADVLARYHRLLGEEVFFSTGTDEHGMTNVRAAKEAGKTPEDFTEEISKRVRDLTEILNLSNDDFIRTTDKKRHWPTVKKVWLKLKENGDIYKKKYKGLYCVGCEAFVKEKDLVDGKCPLHGKTPEAIEEENYFFRLSKYQNQLKKIIGRGEIKIIPESRKSELLSFITQGLEDTSCSRPREKLEWGVPVPDDKTQLIYVWLEALVNYLSALDYAIDGNKFKKFWPPDVHCIGKDIFVRFHGLLWPAMLLSLKLPLPKTIFVHGFVTVNGQKMSKSLGNIYTLKDVLKNVPNPLAFRYLILTSNYRLGLNFTFKSLETASNTLSRLQHFIRKLSEINNSIIESEKDINKIKVFVQNSKNNFKNAMDDDLNASKAMADLFDFIKKINSLIDKNKIGVNAAKIVLNFLQEINQVWGFLKFNKESIDDDLRKTIECLIEKRNKYRFKNDWISADKIRDELIKMGVIIRDNKNSTKWELKR